VLFGTNPKHLGAKTGHDSRYCILGPEPTITIHTCIASFPRRCLQKAGFIGKKERNDGLSVFGY